MDPQIRIVGVVTDRMSTTFYLPRLDLISKLVAFSWNFSSETISTAVS